MNPEGAALVPGAKGNERDPGIRTVLFTDIVGSTELTQRLGDDAAIAFLQVHDMIVRDALGASGGREVKHTGDGIMACFVSTVAAVRCAIRIQAALAAHEQANGEVPIKVRIGAAAGELTLKLADESLATLLVEATKSCANIGGNLPGHQSDGEGDRHHDDQQQSSAEAHELLFVIMRKMLSPAEFIAAVQNLSIFGQDASDHRSNRSNSSPGS